MSVAASASQPTRQITSIAIIGALFFVFGFVTWLNGPLITFVKYRFTLSDIGAFLVLTVFYLSYFFLALPSASLLKRTGMKKGMALGLLVMAVGAFAFGEFVLRGSYPGALAGLFTIGAGLALLQTAANPYISIVGPIEGAAQRIAVMGICNKTAGALAPYAFAVIVLAGIDKFDAQLAAATPVAREALLNDFAAKVHGPYLVMAGILVVLAIALMRSPLPDIRPEEANAAPVTSGASQRNSLMQFPHVWLGALCIFVYVGVEVMAGDAIGTYGSALGLPPGDTRFFTMFTLIAMLVGYLAGLVLIPRFVSQERYLGFSAMLGVLLTFGAFMTSGYVSVGFVAALGFANAMMWPAIFPLAIEGLGRLTERGSALLIMGIAGGAIIPQLFALLKQHIHFQLVFLLLMVPCYLYILYYGMRGHRVGMPASK
ncbi:glucose/galactose transporter [Luteimonas cucumeris]|uniref:Glucose/galactose transporter n=1 Tax=Luteimonas cucumeris TaxID=985012 RepID=A0A562LDY8_9GAMM|nr:sugar MFS transporter [Luteimonas cucumeris]TWI05899.1 glucose/galactose transporter [Luteimonas cucumeris]